jgi:deazaflavin-dependent oxidoreductase (nitroreductase family)
LIVRNRWMTASAPLSLRLYMALIEPAAFIMERKLLLGIKLRAEQGSRHGDRPDARTRGSSSRRAIERVRRQIEHQLDTRSAGLAAWLLRTTNGRIARLWRRRVLVLTTRGRKSGRARSVPLQYFPDGQSMIVLAANSGLDRPPNWYVNLTASPTATVEVDGRTVQVLATELTDEQAHAFWPRVLELAPDYKRYPKRTSRRIPLVRLTPVTSQRTTNG